MSRPLSPLVLVRFGQVIQKRTQCAPERAVQIAEGLIDDLRAQGLDIVHRDWVAADPQAVKRDFWEAVSEMAEQAKTMGYKPWRPD